MYAHYLSRTLLTLLIPWLASWTMLFSQVIEIDEVISREVGVHIGGISTPDIKEVVSRESSFFIENGRVDGEVISREMSVVIDNPGSPPQVTGYTVTPAADGSSVALDWSNYNQWAVRDVGLFRIYLNNQPFSDVTGIEPYTTVPGESVTATLNGLATFQDHYIAIVAVDGLGNFNPAVLYSAAYILTKEVISREVSVAFNAEPQPPYREVVSREVSVVRDNPGAPAPLTDFVVTTSPIGDTATLDWSSYNQWAQYDVSFYRIYYSDTLFTSLSGISHVDIPGETFTHTFINLTPWVDHYFAIVPVDALGNSDPLFSYGTGYVISPEVISREVGVFMGQEPPAPPDVVESVPVANFSFESPDIGNFVYWGSMSIGQRAAFTWTGAGNGGSGPALFNNGGAWNFTNVPDGSQGVSLQGDSSISLAFNLVSAGAYTLRWSAASRSGQLNPYVVKLNGTTVSPVFSTTNTAWQSNSATFEISAPGTHSISFAVVNAVGDNSVGIDAVSLSRYDSEGSRPFSSLRELVSREVSVVRPDDTTPAPVTFAGSSFSATTARTTYKGIALDWRGYNEWAQFDVHRYRIYTSTSFATDVSGMNLHSFAPDDGKQEATITELNAETIYYVAVVAEDVQGNFNPVVYPVSVKTAVAELGPVANLTAVPTATTITFSWDLGGVGDELADFVKAFLVYFNGSDEPIVLGPTARSWTAASLTPETSYSVRVETVDLLGNPSLTNNPSASATTLQLPEPLAYWRFEEGQVGTRVPNTAQGTLNVSPVLDSTTQGNHLSTYNEDTAPTYQSSAASSLVPGSLAVNQRCLDFSPNQDLYTSVGTLQNIRLDRFTIEASFNPDGLNRWQVITGRDGSVSGNAPSIRLMQRGDNNRLHVFMVDATGTFQGVDSLQPATPGQWHHLIATYDGISLKLYLRRNGQSAPVLQGTTVTNGGVADRPAGWTVGRGWWGTYADWCDGRIDEVRITGEVLPESQFLYAGSVFADWLEQNFTVAELGNPQISGLLADADQDGLATLVEYALGTLPLIADGSPLTGSRFIYSEGERLRMIVPRDPAKNDITVEVLAASDLTGPWTVVATSELGAPFTGPGYFAGDGLTPGLKSVEIRDVVNVQDANRRFMRVKVTKSTPSSP